MATRITIDATTTLEFSDDPEALRYGDIAFPQAPQNADDKFFHVPGVDGNYHVRMGQTGRPLVVDVVYYGTEAAAYGALNDDLAEWGAAAASITFAGVTWTRCNLIRSEPVVPRKVDGTNIRLPVRLHFNIDSGD